MEKTIAAILGLNNPEIKKHNKATPIALADPQLAYGLELEIENVPNWNDLVVTGYMTAVDDGSLRNSGKEFLTLPATGSVVRHVLELFFNKAKLSDKNYSDRTSIHVHCNCTDLTLEQLKSVLLLYQIFEKMLYAFIGHERDKNIFCVPWSESNVSYKILEGLNPDNVSSVVNLKNWQKYLGLNLLPLFKYGTIEFRHMEGNCNLERVMSWLNLIGSLFAFAKRHTFKQIKDKVFDLNTSSQYGAITEEIFTQWAVSLMQNPYYRQHLEDGVLAMKYMFFQEASESKKNRNLEDIYADLARHMAPAPEEYRPQYEPAPRLRTASTARVDLPVYYNPFVQAQVAQAGTEPVVYDDLVRNEPIRRR